MKKKPKKTHVQHLDKAVDIYHTARAEVVVGELRAALDKMEALVAQLTTTPAPTTGVGEDALRLLAQVDRWLTGTENYEHAYLNPPHTPAETPATRVRAFVAAHATPKTHTPLPPVIPTTRLVALGRLWHATKAAMEISPCKQARTARVRFRDKEALEEFTAAVREALAAK